MAGVVDLGVGIGKVSSILRDFTEKIDSNGEIDGIIHEELSTAIHVFCKSFPKEKRKEGAWKEVIKLLNSVDDTMMAIKTSFSAQQTAWQNNMKQVRRSNQSQLQRTVVALRAQGSDAQRKVTEELRQQISVLEVEKEQLLSRLGFGHSAPTSSSSSSPQPLPPAGYPSTLETKVAEGALSSSNVSLPVRPRNEDKTPDGHALLASGTGDTQAQTIFECLRLHEEVIACRQKLASQELSEQAVREELKRAQAEIKARDEDILVLKEAVGAAGRRFDETKDKHNADLRRLSNEYIAQKAHFREIMNKFRSQVETEMGRQREEAVARIKREREAIATSSAVANERSSEKLHATLSLRVSALQARQKEELASARHMHKQELQRVLGENDRLKRLLYNNNKSIGGEKKEPKRQNHQSSSSVSSSREAVDPWYSPLANRNELPWGSGRSSTTSGGDMTLGLSEGARQFSNELDKLLQSLGPDGEVEVEAHARVDGARGSISGGGSRKILGSSSSGAPRPRRAPTPPLPARGQDHDKEFMGGSGHGHNPFILSANKSSPGAASFGSSASSYRGRFESRVGANSPDSLVASGLGADALSDGTSVEPIELVAQRAEERALAAADEAARRYRIAQKTSEELELEADLASISRGSPAAMDKALAQAKALSQARLLAAEARKEENGGGDDDTVNKEDREEEHKEKEKAAMAVATAASRAVPTTLTLEDLASRSLLSPKDESLAPQRPIVIEDAAASNNGHEEGEDAEAAPYTASLAAVAMAAQQDAQAGRELLGGHLLNETTFLEEWNDSFSEAMRLGR